MFQSLLSWISRFGFANVVRNSRLGFSFNPCCLGLAVLAIIPDWKNLLIMEFQSLLSWISRFGMDWFSGQVLPWRGFNPCCLGLAVLAIHPE